MRILPIAFVSAVALCTAIASPQAASIGSAAKVLKIAADASITEKIAYRRCWWRQGVRYCRRYQTGYAPYYGGYPFSQRYYSGSSIGIIMGIQ
jgi:hypothetical protein